jgi:hypothetical protein
MTHVIDSYLTYLATHPSVINSIILWNTTNVFIWFILIRYRTKMIEGVMGENKLWEAPEQIAYLLLFLFPPILTYSAFFNSELPSWCWYFLSFAVAYTLGGRWLLEWILAFKSGSNKVEDTQTEKPKPE